MGGAVEMCSGLGACRKTLEGTMCPSYMATRDEQHSTRGRANVLRLAMAGRLGEAGLGDEGVYEALDLCLECRACKAECPVGVDVARFKSEFLADYWQRHGTPLEARVLGNARRCAEWGSRLAPLSNWIAGQRARRAASTSSCSASTAGGGCPQFKRRTLARPAAPRRADRGSADALLFNDTFTNYYDPRSAWPRSTCSRRPASAPRWRRNRCCGRPQISKGLLGDARELAARNADALYADAAAGRPIVFCEPSCLSAVREDAPALLRGEARRKADRSSPVQRAVRGVRRAARCDACR